MPHIKINLLGAMQVWVDDSPIRKFRSSKTAALLATLILEARPLPRSTLATRFWPDASQKKAHEELKRCLSDLRTKLPNCIQSSRETAVFTPPPQFTLDINKVKTDFNSGSIDFLYQACQLCTGPLLEGLTLPDAPRFDRWLAHHRLHWRQTAVSLHQALIHSAQQKRDWQMAVWAGNQLLQHAPEHEATHRQLMRLYLRLNQREQALSQFHRCKKTLEETLAIEPSQATRNLFEAVRAKDSWLAHNLPQQKSSFEGRQSELRQLLSWLDDASCSLITIIGPGGMGKTRLAQQAARQMRGAFVDGIFWVDLEPLDEPHLFANEIAKAVGIQLFGTDNPWERVLARLAKQDALLLLDNLEHLQRHLLQPIQELQQRAPTVKLLITSRQRLPLLNIRQLTLTGLSSPPEQTASRTAATAYSAVRLFLNRARQQRSKLQLAPNSGAIQEICAKVGGMPLAIEMAAAWCATYTPKQIASNLNKMDNLLKRQFSDPADRQFSMRTIFEQSWAQLKVENQVVFTQLAIFQGGFTHEAAQVVTQATDNQLATLINHSLLQRDENGRYHFHPLLLQFAREKFASLPKQTKTTARFIDYFVTYVESRNVTRFGNQLIFIGELTDELPNIHKLWALLLHQHKFMEMARCIDSIWSYGELSGQMQEVDQLLIQAIESWQGHRFQQKSNPILKYAMFGLNLRHSWFGFRLGQFQRANRIIEQTFEFLYETPPNKLPDIRSHFFYTAGLLYWYEGKYSKARQMLLKCLKLGEAHQDLFAQDLGHQLLAFIFEYEGDSDKAAEHYQLANEVASLIDDQRGRAVNYITEARMNLYLGNLSTAQSLLQQARSFVQDDDQFVVTLFTLMRGVSKWRQGDFEGGLQQINKSISMAKENNDQWFLAYGLQFQAQLLIQTNQLDQACRALTYFIVLCQEMELPPILLEGMGTIVFLLRKFGNNQLSEQLAFLVLSHSATPAHTRYQLRDFKSMVQTNAQRPFPDLWETAVFLKQKIQQLSHKEAVSARW